MPQWFIVVAFALTGLLFGSFANVVIWRFPRGESVVSPGSHCPGCGHAIRWYDNIPVLSWLLLRARCRDCGEPIAVRYPLVEALSGILFAAAALAYPSVGQAVFAAAAFWLLLVLSAIDLDCMRLPNPLVATLALLGLSGAVAAQLLGQPLVPLVPLPDGGLLSSPVAFSILGAVLGAGTSGGVAGLYGAVRGKQGLGMGDVKLLGALGMYLGPYVLLALFAGSLIGVVVGLSSARRDRSARIPFGPSLAAGGILVALWGPVLVSWYFGLF